MASVSVVIPAKNEAKFIGRCLKSIEELEPLETIVVDNGSTDGTPQIAEAHGARVVHRPGVLVGAVRNAGAEVATGELIAFIDGDCIAGPEWISAAAAQLHDPVVGAVGGGYLPNPEGTWVERAWADSVPKPPSSMRALPGGSIVMRRNDFLSLGKFDEHLSAGEDDELCTRVRKAGLKVLSIPQCYVIHLGYPSSLRNVARRQIWHGSHQLYVAESALQTQLLMTHCFLFGQVLMVAAVLSASSVLLPIALLLLTVPTSALAFSKARDRRRPVLVFFQMLVVGFWFYLGRAWGLVLNYVELAKRISEPSSL